MDVPATSVVSQHSRLRDLFPFYSIDMLLFSAALLAATYGLMLWLNAPVPLFLTLSGYLGAVAVNRAARPSYMLIKSQQQGAFISLLERSHYRYVPGMDHWVPPLPRWLRWKCNYVQLCANGNVVRVAGPANVLRVMAAKAS
jgi:hypothetical protein